MAERIQRSGSGYARELAAWAPPPDSLRLDGVSPSSYPARPDRTCPYFPGRDFARGHGCGLPASSPAAATRFTGAALHSQPVEIGWLREMIRNQVGDGSYPQLVLRLGTVIQNAVSVRRLPESVLLSTR